MSIPYRWKISCTDIGCSVDGGGLFDALHFCRTEHARTKCVCLWQHFVTRTFRLLFWWLHFAMGATDCVCVQRSYDHSFLGVIDNHATQICGVIVRMDNIHSLTTNADDFSRIGLRRFSSLLVRLCPLHRLRLIQ